MRTAHLFLSTLLLWSGLTTASHADVLVASFDSFGVLRYDDATGRFLDTFARGLPGDRPSSMAFGPDGNLYVTMANFSAAVASSVRRFDGQTGTFIDTFAEDGGLLGAGDLAFGPDGNLYVANFGLAANSKIIRYDGRSGAYLDDFVPVGSGGLRGAEGIVFGPDGNLYVTSRITNQVLRYDGATGAFLGVFATGGDNGPIDLVFGSDGKLYVLNSVGTSLQVLRFDGLTGAFVDVFVDFFRAGTDGSSLAFGPDGALYVTTGFIGNSVRRFDGTTGQYLGELIRGGRSGLAYASGLLFAPAPFQRVAIDIRPNLRWNPVRPHSKGLISVAVLSTESFDATLTDPDSVRFGPRGARDVASWRRRKDVDGDGAVDLLLRFAVADTGIVCGDRSAVLRGSTLSGERFEGFDSVRTPNCP
jgi:WD40 repeat protein